MTIWALAAIIDSMLKVRQLRAFDTGLSACCAHGRRACPSGGLQWHSLVLTHTDDFPLAKWEIVRAELFCLLERPLVQLSCLRSTVGRLTHHIDMLLAVVPMGKAFLQACFMLMHWHSDSSLVQSRWPSGREPVGAAAKTWLSLTPTARTELLWHHSLGPRHELPARCSS